MRNCRPVEARNEFLLIVVGRSQRLGELDRLAIQTGARVFPPIGDLASLASFRMDGHPYAPLASAVEEVLLGVPV